MQKKSRECGAQKDWSIATVCALASQTSPPPHPLILCLLLVRSLMAHLANCTGNGECACRLCYPIKGREAVNTYIRLYKCT